jgi:hypothetical protein
MSVKEVSGIRKEFMASSIKSQMNRFSRILNVIENDEVVDTGHFDSSLKEIEISLRKIRKEFNDN